MGSMEVGIRSGGGKGGERGSGERGGGRGNGLLTVVFVYTYLVLAL